MHQQIKLGYVTKERMITQINFNLHLNEAKENFKFLHYTEIQLNFFF